MSIKVLVADDSGTMRKIITRSLNAVGIDNVVEACDGLQAFEVYQQANVDLVLTDWNMPGQSGLDLVKAIRATDQETPIVLITTEAEKSRVIEAVQAGVSDYIVKPFEAEQLLAKLVNIAGESVA